MLVDECELCAGSGEVTITPVGGDDSQASEYGCPLCIARERDELQKQVWALAHAASKSAALLQTGLSEIVELTKSL